MTEAERELLDQGVVLIPNYIDAGTFEALLEEVERGAAKFLKGSPEPDKFGIVRQQISVHRYPKDFPIAHRVLLQNENLLHAIRVSEGWSDKDDFSNKGTVLKYEKLEQVAEPVSVEESRDDENSSGDMHSDSFHVVTKAFLTLTPLTRQNSPFLYCRGSQRLSLGRLRYEFGTSVRSDQYDRGEFRRRVLASDILRMGLKPDAVTADRNTMLITDTCGFHLRGRMTVKGAVRKMLRLDFRSNPFTL